MNARFHQVDPNAPAPTPTADTGEGSETRDALRARVLSAYGAYKAKPCNLTSATALRSAFKAYMVVATAAHREHGEDAPGWGTTQDGRIGEIFLQYQGDAVFHGLPFAPADGSGITQQALASGEACGESRSAHS